MTRGDGGFADLQSRSLRRREEKPLDLDGAVALVTGGASGIGAATAARLRDLGARVAVLDLQAHEGEGDLAVQCDVGDEDDVVGAVQRVVDELGPPRVAVLAAGVGGMSPILQMSADEWDRVHRVNIRGVFLCLREAARAMVAAGQPGAIVATGSVSGIVSDRGIVNYSTSPTSASATCDGVPVTTPPQLPNRRATIAATSSRSASPAASPTGCCTDTRASPASGRTSPSLSAA